ncbi:helix-turn-helix domain-containing protein [Streptomyces flavofungini]|uniref:helix-turn-helix domain-containing protein n=1 Tax=Streptomyces flavofungini TaxID=68200 RepID=UPI0034DE20B0
MSARSATAESPQPEAESVPEPAPESSADVAAAFSRWLAPVAEPSDGRARGRVTLHHLGYVRLLACDTGPLRLTRRPGTATARPGEDAVALLLPREGTLRLAQHGRATSVAGGEAALLDLRTAFSLDRPDGGRLLALRVPLHALHVPATALRPATARVLARPACPAAELLPHLEASAGLLPAEVGERLGGFVTDLVAALVEDAAEDEDGPPPSGRHQLTGAIRRYIDQHLSDPGLSAERVAAAHLISTRYLHRLFESEGITVGRLIQLRRVERCAQELTRRARVSPSVAVVAARWGFGSAAHFSRAFKAVYGCPPQQWRRMAARTGELPAPAPLDAGGSPTPRTPVPPVAG